MTEKATTMNVENNSKKKLNLDVIFVVFIIVLLNKKLPLTRDLNIPYFYDKK